MCDAKSWGEFISNISLGNLKIKRSNDLNKSQSNIEAPFVCGFGICEIYVRSSSLVHHVVRVHCHCT